mgnify:CR=1 FL=1
MKSKYTAQSTADIFLSAQLITCESKLRVPCRQFRTSKSIESYRLKSYKQIINEKKKQPTDEISPRIKTNFQFKNEEIGKSKRKRVLSFHQQHQQDGKNTVLWTDL